MQSGMQSSRLLAHLYATHHHCPNREPHRFEVQKPIQWYHGRPLVTGSKWPKKGSKKTSDFFNSCRGASYEGWTDFFATTSNIYSYQRFTCPMKASTKLGICIYIESTHLSSKSHHEDCYSFSGECISTIINHCCLVAGRSKVYSFNPAFALCR